MSIALWCLFVAGLLHVVTKVPLSMAQNQAGGYDNHSPREQQAALQGWGKRALAAHQNQIESFPFFAAGVLAATATGVTGSVADYLALAYVLARLVYLYCYLKDIALLRSVVWGVGFLSSLALLCSPAWGH
ncbi:MAG: MAPEG family protein [Gammaproteobacteria bacterium]|uniref:MAPEG family protein n=1 Tax=Pseudomaricurvus alcaniphilus TaxID=1166482 RepID=UPI00140B5D88|nr:MAPEG family protein [Pseudomaricurvus alcaniphilus]MBR9912575.1 MAPEG family protein [Gammaproteobacteria bacterium]NHN39749.1 MAPEG family protein [Pseudomaricurvus alcaniphilus]